MLVRSASSIPTYLIDLDLPGVFSTYSSAVGNYILESTFDEHVVDSNTLHISGFVTSSFGQSEDVDEKFFAVSNPSGNPYALLQIDNGIIQSSITKKCDCAITNDSIICFIEFKANATSNKRSSIEKNYRKAIEQLITTIGMFDAYHIPRGVDIRVIRNAQAFICFRHGFPRRTSSQMNYQVSFAISSRGIPLSFETTKIL